ncbi:MAG: hypothetical protein LBB23_03685 [Rickettsiales bacterium]|nr:hypothetical protein [Rickettsiales bacterium]
MFINKDKSNKICFSSRRDISTHYTSENRHAADLVSRRAVGFPWYWAAYRAVATDLIGFAQDY